MNRWLLALACCVMACAKPRTTLRPMPAGHPEILVAHARSQSIKGALHGKFSTRLNTGSRDVTLPVSLLINHPDQFRVELLTPLGTPLLYLTSNGSSLHAWSQRDKVFYRGDEATDVLHRVTGGSIGLHDFLALFTARLPMVDAEILHIGRTIFDDEGVVLIMLGPDDIRIRAVVDPQTGMVRSLRVDPPDENSGFDEPEGEPLILVTYEGLVRINKLILPKHIHVSLPKLGWTVEMEAKKWKSIEQVPDAFNLVPPKNSTIKDLTEALRQIEK
jgi:hypothetical protein